MPELTSSCPETELMSEASGLPIGSIVRALCQAANAGPDQLYEVMIKLSLLVEATAPMYGLSIWTVDDQQKPRLNWAEGLDEEELAEGQRVVHETLSSAVACGVMQGADTATCVF